MTAGKAVALFVAWFALTVVFVKVGLSIGIALGVTIGRLPVYKSVIGYQLVENSTSWFAFYARALLANEVLFASVFATPIAIVVWKRERIYSLLGGDLTNVRRSLTLFAAGLVLVIAVNAVWVIVPVLDLVLVVILSPLFEYDLDWLGFLALQLLSIIIRVILPVVIVVWKRQAIYSILRVG